MVVGWYHSHPGFGCWLSGVDINTQQSFEQLNARAVSIVVDPIQSVKGKVRRAARASSCRVRLCLIVSSCLVFKAKQYKTKEGTSPRKEIGL